MTSDLGETPPPAETPADLFPFKSGASSTLSSPHKPVNQPSVPPPQFSRAFWVGSVCTAIVIVYVVGIGIKNLIRYNAFKIEQKGLEKDLAKEEKIHQGWVDLLSKTDSDEFWEIQAKQKLGFTKQGEIVYRLINPPH